MWGDFFYLESGSKSGCDSVPLVSVGRGRSASAGMLATSARGLAARFATVEPRLVYFSASRLDAQAHQMIPPFLFMWLRWFFRGVCFWGVENESGFQNMSDAASQKKGVMLGRVQL